MKFKTPKHITFPEENLAQNQGQLFTEHVRTGQNGWNGESNHHSEYRPRRKIPCHGAQRTGNDFQKEIDKK